MKTVLHTIDTTGPGGAETVFIDIASNLPRDRYRSLVCIRGKGWVYEELRRRGFDPVIIPAKGSFNLSYLRALASLIREQGVDLVQSHLLGANVYCSMAGLLTRTPVIATFHGMVDIGINERFRGLKSAAINRGAQHIVAVSSTLGDDILQQSSLRQDKLEVIYNGINTAAFQKLRNNELRREFGWNESDFVVGCLGNVRPAKGYDVLLEAAQLCKQQGRNFRFLVAGQGRKDLDGPLEAYIAEHDLSDSVKFLGFIDDAAAFLAGIDLFALPSTSEGFSISTIQAMAAGLPVLVTRSGGPEEIVEHGRTGFMVAPGDAPALAEGLVKLADDIDLRNTLAQQGQQHAVAKFDVQSMLNGYMALYDQV